MKAAEKSDTGGKVRIATGTAGGRAFLRIDNNGPAIAADQRDRIFEPFFSTREKGTGLGLAFVREIAADHGGTITLADGGDLPTRFELSVPAGS
jgi:signal transduction histidine kinase